MKAVCKKLFSLMLVAILLVSAVPFQASAEEVTETVAPTAAATEAAVVETEAAVAPAAELEVTTPAANAEVVEKLERYIEFQVTVNGMGPYRVGNLVKTKIGSTVGTPGEGTVLNVVKSITGSSAGYKLIRWELNDNTTFTSSTTISLSMATDGSYPESNKDDADYIDSIEVNAIVEYVAKDITLNANGGTVAKNKHTVEVGQQYDYYGGLPTPTRSNYSFAGWFKDDGTQVTNESIVTDLSKLTAKWNGNKYTVIFQGYDGGWDEVGFGSFSVDANSVLKTAYNNFPTEQQIKDMFLTPVQADGWYIDGWEYSVDNGSTWNTFTAGSTKITGNTIVRPLYKKSITLYACDSGNTTRSLTVTLGKRYPTLPHPGTRDGYAFVGWFLEPEASTLISTKADLSNVSKHEYVEYDHTALYAGWDNAKTVYLYIHTNGNTDEHTKLVRYYDVPATGFDLTDIDLGDIFPNYGKYDDKGDEKYGWYDNAQWKNYVLNKHVNDTTEYVTSDYLDTDDVHEFYIMLIDNGNNTSTGAANGNGYNDNTTTRDPSNPSTGDDIFVAVTVMAVSACALLLFFLNKKRIAK